MILANVSGAVAVYYADALERGGRPVGDVIRYVGATDDDCCSPDKAGQVAGTLRVNVAKLGVSQTPPNIFPIWGKCQAKAVAELHVRLIRCWPSAADTKPEVWDAKAAELLDDAWILGCSTSALMNDVGLLELCDDDGQRVGCTIGGWTVLPLDPQGGCAGNELVMYVSLTGPCTVVRDSGS